MLGQMRYKISLYIYIYHIYIYIYIYHIYIYIYIYIIYIYIKVSINVYIHTFIYTMSITSSPTLSLTCRSTLEPSTAWRLVTLSMEEPTFRSTSVCMRRIAFTVTLAHSSASLSEREGYCTSPTSFSRPGRVAPSSRP